jgi:hypothetical protein
MARCAPHLPTLRAFLDSTSTGTRGAVYLGLAAYFVTIGPPLQEWLILATRALAAPSSEHVRARAQSLGFVCKTGLFQRPSGSCHCDQPALRHRVRRLDPVRHRLPLAIVTNITALQRIREVWLRAGPSA